MGAEQSDSSTSCIFCRIASGEVPARRVHEDDEIVAFEDANPQAPTHALVVPRTHIPTVNDLGPKHEGLIGRMILVAKGVAAKKGLADRGYRLVWNCLEEAGQSVFHLHLHVLGGRSMKWPPG
jgi:histidine triad (HIT) family protein